MSSTATPIEPFWNHQPEIARYPFRGAALVALVTFSLVSLLGLLPGIGWLLGIVVLAASYRYAFEILVCTAHGRMEAPEITTHTGCGVVWRFIVLWLLYLILIVASMMIGGIGLNIVAMLLLCLLLPGATVCHWRDRCPNTSRVIWMPNPKRASKPHCRSCPKCDPSAPHPMCMNANLPGSTSLRRCCALLLLWLTATGCTPAPSARWQETEPGVLRDAGTGLQWTRSDNGNDIDWPGAMAHCASLTLSGGGWQLPNARQLRGLYDTGEEERTPCGHYQDDAIACRASGLLNLSGPFFWSADSNGPDHAFGVFMTNGYRLSYIRTARFNDRALCVRTSSS